MTASACTVGECTNVAYSRGYCSPHYQRFKRHGDPTAGGRPRRRRRTTNEAGRLPSWAPRFFAKVHKTDGCWIWTGALSSKASGRGYGTFWADGQIHKAHRLAYELHIGPIPDGRVIDHKCRDTRCVNPDHLQAVTQRENSEHQGAGSNSTSGERGVSFHKRDQRWQAYIRVNRRTIHLGYFLTKAEAAEAARAARLHHFTNSLLDQEEAA